MRSALKADTHVTTWIRRLAPYVVCVLVAVLVEVVAFNYKHWATLGNEPVDLLSSPTVVSSADDVLTFEGIGVDANDITIEFSSEQGSELVFATYSVTDDGSSSPYDLAEVEMQKSVASSCTQSLSTYGSLESLSITFGEGTEYNDNSISYVDGNTYPIYVESVTLDTVVPFSFSLARCALLAGALCLVWLFRPGSGLYRRGALESSCVARAVRVALVVVPSVACVLVVLSYPGWVQLASRFYNSSSWDGSSVVNHVYPSWYHSKANDEYTELARALADGQLYLEEDPPAWLEEINPYDNGARVEEVAETGEGYKVDAAYYDGHYYVYFGVVPVLLLYLPFHLITGGDFPNAVAVLLPCVLYVAGLFRLLRGLVRRWFHDVSLGALSLVYLGALLCSGLLFSLGRASMYQVPIAFARCLAVWALCLWLEGDERGSVPRLAAGSLCMALVAGCRPQMLVLAPLVVPVLVRTVRDRERRAAGTAALLVPFALVAAGVMWYNAARFSSPLDFGASYNLTTNDVTLRGFDAGRLVDGILFYLVQPAVVTGVFPFLQTASTSVSYMGLSIVEPTCGGVFATYPFLWSLALLRKVRDKARWAAAVCLYLLVAGIVVACFDAEAGGLLGRYYQDFLMAFALGAAVAFLCLVDGRPSDSGVHVALRVSVALAAVFTLLLVFFMKSFTGQVTSGGSSPAAWEALRQTFMLWT